MDPENVQPLQPPFLTISRDKAEEQIRVQMQEASRIRDISIEGWEALRAAKDEESAWTDYTTELLTRTFSNFSEDEKFRKFQSELEDNSHTDFHNQGRYLEDRMNRSIAYLDSLLNRLHLIPELDECNAKTSTAALSQPQESQELKHAFELYKKAQALLQYAQPLDERIARMIIESANDAIKDFGSTNQDKKIELRKVIAEAEKVLPPASIEELRRRTEGEILQRTYPRKKAWRNLIIGIVALIIVLWFVGPVLSLLWSSGSQSAADNKAHPEQPSFAAKDKEAIAKGVPSPDLEVQLPPISLVIQPDVSDQHLEQVLQSLRTSRNLRALAPLESGKSIEKTPAGTYFFIPSAYFSYKEKQQKELLESDAVRSMRRDSDDHFEVHKLSENQIDLIAFVSSDVAHSISRLDGKTRRDVVCSSVPWADNKTMIIVPFNRIVSAKWRRVETPDTLYAPIIDVTLR